MSDKGKDVMSGENNAQNETQKTAAYSDEFRELIRKRLARDCTVVKDEQGEEHYVWKDTSDGLLPEIQLNKMRYRPYAWHFIQKTGYNPVYSMRKKCFYPGLCISHYVPVQNKRKRAEMEEVQFEDKTKEAEYIMAHLDESSRDFEIQRFLNLTKVNDADCHEWQGFLDVKGYGHHKIYGVTVRAHRAAWILKNKQIIGDAVIRHMCGNTKCVNFEHLQIGTHAENMNDMKLSAAHCIGSKTANAKINEKMAADIFALKDQKLQTEIAKQFCVNEQIVNKIMKGRSWSHVTKLQNPDVGKKKPKFKEFDLQDSDNLDNLKLRIRKNCKIVMDDYPSAHWLWTNTLTKQGYGKISVCSTSLRAHRVSWMAYNEQTLQPNQLIRHKCQHKHCVNPNHIEIGTAQDNAQDRIRDGTQHRNCSITEDVAWQIKISKGQGSQMERAKRFRTTLAVVKGIDVGRCWKHLD